MKTFQGRSIAKGQAQGLVMISPMKISFFGGVDPDTGVVMEKGHDLEGQCIAGKVLIFPSGKGSTVGSYTLYRLQKNLKAPAAIINELCEPIIAVGCIIAEIPCIDLISIGFFKPGSTLWVNASIGIIQVE